ncbi:jg20160 [Pararge aegeria aegeria]|uniref:Jg20160 protein n=1 Tax=Pararge aegeria aegeria TaxID=348720 RepID=A0A8S4RYZ6_9NEOP|nr:jg20160 [Pararge aegeria aegeria]
MTEQNKKSILQATDLYFLHVPTRTSSQCTQVRLPSPDTAYEVHIRQLTNTMRAAFDAPNKSETPSRGAPPSVCAAVPVRHPKDLQSLAST